MIDSSGHPNQMPITNNQNGHINTTCHKLITHKEKTSIDWGQYRIFKERTTYIFRTKNDFSLLIHPDSAPTLFPNAIFFSFEINVSGILFLSSE